MADAIELGVAYLSIVGETNRLVRSVKDGMREAQRHADRNPIAIKANVDFDMAQDELDRLRGAASALRSLRNVSDKNISVKIRLDMPEAEAERLETIAPALRSIRGLSDKNISVKIRLDMPEAEAERLEAIAPALRSIRGLSDKDVTIKIDLQVDEVRLQRVAEALRDIRSQSVRLNVDTNADRAASDVDRLRVSMGGLGSGAGKTAAVAAGIAAIGGAAGAAVGAVGLLATGLLALGPAAAAAAATAAVGVAGIGDAFKALEAAEDAAGREGEAQAKAVAAAQEQVEAAIEGVADAQRNLASAQEDAAEATKDAQQATADIADAYKDAAAELEDYQLKLADAALSEKEAALAVREAEKAVREAKPEDREKALLRLERANLRYAQAQDENRETQEEATEAEAKGVEGSDKVVAAKERAADANGRAQDAIDRVADAERQLTKAHDQVAKAQQAVTDAATKSSAAQDKAAKAMAELSPNAREFVLAARELKPLWDDLVGDPTQDALFAGAADGLRDLAESVLPTVGAGMTDVAASMNGLTHQFAAFWAAPENLAGIESIFAGTANFIDGLGPGLQQATQGFLSLGQAFEPVANQVGAQFGGMLGQIGQAFTDAFESGALTELIGNFGNILESLGLALNPLLDGLIEAGNIIAPSLGPFLEQLGTTLGDIAGPLAQLGATFLDALTPVLPVLGDLITALAEGLEPVLPVLSTLLQSVGNALIPLIGPISEIAQVVGTALTTAINALAPAIGPIGDAFASLVTAAAPLIEIFANVASGLLQALAPALEKIFDALAPVLQQWADLMIPVFKEIQPILEEVAGEIGTAIADALNAIAPLLPDIAKSFSGLLLAVLPLLPELVRLGTELLPPLIDLWLEMAPVMLDVIDALTWLVNNVIVPLVIPALQRMSDNFTTAIETATSVVRGAKDYLSDAIDDIGRFFTGLGSTVTDVWDGIVRTIKGAVGKIGKFLADLPEIKIPDLPGIPGRGTKIGFQGIGRSMVAWSQEGMRDGGLFHGAGSGTSDSNLIRISDREFVVNAAATAENLPLLERINAGWTPSAAELHSMFPGFKDGGMVAGKKFATSMDSADYLMGGFSRSAIDCSAMVSAVVNDALGLDPFDSRMSTVNEGDWLAAKGAVPGIGGPGDISVGWFDNGGGANGHTALTLGDGTNVESRAGDGVVVGGSAAGADDPMFDQHMYIPEKLLRGGDPGAGVTTRGLGPNTSGDRKVRSGGTSGGGMKKSRQSAGGGATSGAAGEGGQEEETGSFGGVTDVFVTNWPTDLGAGITPGGPAGEGIPLTYDDPAAAATTYGTDTQTYTAPASTPSATAPTPDSSAHPLAHIPLPGAAAGLFQGPAPWFMAATPEQALANLGSQAGSLAQRGLSDVQGFFQDNWQEMLETGAGVLGMGAMGGGGNTTYNISGTDPMSAAAAVDRVHRRRSLATQRSGGFGR